MADGSNDGLVDRAPRSIVVGAPEVGPLSLGCWRMIEVDSALAAFDTAIELGMNLIDTADVYGLDWGGSGFGENERVLGEVLARRPGARGQIVVATKGGIIPGVPYDSSDRYLRTACDDSLRRLGVDVIDLYQVHRPDVFTSPRQLAETLAGLVDSGKVRAVGVSNMTVAQVDALQAALGERGASLATNQVELSVAHLGPLRDGTVDRVLRDEMTLLAWSPLAGGRLATGDGVRPELVQVLDELAEREGVDRTTAALAFVLALPGRPIAIVGTQRPERLREAARAVDVHLARADSYRLIEASEGVPLP
ncbi:MAG TPA: aldo/keto reductase [Acidimicrobiales bacterium]|nr:aldo/keto reductase [Acidimicrobiales bacterium]